MTGLSENPAALKQIVAVAVIGLLVTAFELVFFLKIVVPTVKSGMAGLLGSGGGDGSKAAAAPGEQGGARPWVRTLVGTLDERERTLIDANNQSAVWFAIAIVLFMMGFVVALYGSFPALRRAPQRDLIVDVCLVFGCIGAFQVFFFFFAKNWNYTDTSELVVAVADEYNADGRPAANCAVCLWDDAKMAQATTASAQQLSATGLPPDVASVLASLNTDTLATEMSDQVKAALLSLSAAARTAVHGVMPH